MDQGLFSISPASILVVVGAAYVSGLLLAVAVWRGEIGSAVRARVERGTSAGARRRRATYPYWRNARRWATFATKLAAGLAILCLLAVFLRKWTSSVPEPAPSHAYGEVGARAGWSQA